MQARQAMPLKAFGYAGLEEQTKMWAKHKKLNWAKHENK